MKISNEHFFKDKDLSDVNIKVFNSLLNQLDSQRNYFTEYEIKTFQKFESYDNINAQKKENHLNVSLT